MNATATFFDAGEIVARPRREAARVGVEIGDGDVTGVAGVALWGPLLDTVSHGKDDGEVVRRARQLAQVIGDAGVEVRELHTDDPGEVIWEDMKQVLARPSGPVGRAF